MARQRDYKAEYARRVVRERERGFTGYPQARRVRSEIVKEVKRLQELHPEVKVPTMRTSAGRHEFQLYAKAQKIIGKRGLTGERGANKRLPDKLKENIIKMLKEKHGDDWRKIYHPLMRSFY